MILIEILGLSGSFVRWLEETSFVEESGSWPVCGTANFYAGQSCCLISNRDSGS